MQLFTVWIRHHLVVQLIELSQNQDSNSSYSLKQIKIITILFPHRNYNTFYLYSLKNDPQFRRDMAKFYGVDSYRSTDNDLRRSNSLLANAGSGIMHA